MKVLGTETKSLLDFPEVAKQNAVHARLKARLAESETALRDLQAKRSTLMAAQSDHGYMGAAALAVIEGDDDEIESADMAALNVEENEQLLRNRVTVNALQTVAERLTLAERRAALEQLENIKPAIRKKVQELAKALAKANELSAELLNINGELHRAGFTVEVDTYLEAAPFRPVITHGDLLRWLEMMARHSLLSRKEITALNIENRMPAGADPMAFAS